jgi:hypothetical protein
MTIIARSSVESLNKGLAKKDIYPAGQSVTRITNDMMASRCYVFPRSMLEKLLGPRSARHSDARAHRLSFVDSWIARLRSLQVQKTGTLPGMPSKPKPSTTHRANPTPTPAADDIE